MRHRRPFGFGGGQRMASVLHIDRQLRKPHKPPTSPAVPQSAVVASGLAALTLISAGTAGRDPHVAVVDATLADLSVSAAIVSNIHASVDATLTGLSLSADARSSRTAALGATLGSLSASATLRSSVTGAVDRVLAALTASSTIAVGRIAALDVTLGALTGTATAIRITRSAALDATLGAVTVSGDARTSRTAAASATLGAATVSAAALTNLRLSVNTTLAALSVTATGRSSRTATLTASLAALTSSAVAIGLTRTPVVDVTLDALTSSADARTSRTAAASATLDAATLSAVAFSSIRAATDTSLAALTLSATGSTSRTAALNTSLAALTSAATVGAARAVTLNAPLAALTLAATGSTSRTAALDRSLAALALSATARLPRIATLGATLGAASVSATVASNRTAALSRTLAALTVSATAGTNRTATLNRTLAALTSSATATSGGVFQPTLYAPMVPLTVQAGDVVGLIVENAPSAMYVTFGHPFVQGDLQPSDSLVSRFADNSVHPVQIDVKATHGDGSVRHAVLTTRVPSGTTPLMLNKSTTAPPSPVAPNKATLLGSGYNATVTIGAEVISAAAVLAGITPVMWLSGDLVNQFLVPTTAISGKLKIQFYISAYADGRTAVDVIFDNSWFSSSGKTDLSYTAAMTETNAAPVSQTVTHTLYKFWRQQIGTPSPNIQFDVPYVLEAGALPNYSLALGVDTASVQTQFDALDATNTAPFGTANVRTDMPGAGARPDIGPQPNWVAQWLISQNATSRAVMMANANVAGGIPWHFTDENTGYPINRETYPIFWQDDRNQVGSYWGPTPANGWPPYGVPWIPQAPHQPDLNYVPYLVTGSLYYLRLLQSQANFAITSGNPYYDYYPYPSIVDPLNPGGALYAGQGVGEEREIAWDNRQVAEAAYITPDSQAIKSYFVSQLTKTMHGFVQNYITNDAMAAYGQIKGFVLGSETVNNALVVAPWQQGYIVTSLARIASMNLGQPSTDALLMLNFMSNFVSGLLTNGGNGYSALNGTPYYLYIVNPATSVPLTTWAQLQTVNLANFNPAPGPPYGLQFANPTQFQPDPPNQATDMEGGYAVIARCVTAMIFGRTGITQAQTAFDYLVNEINVEWATVPLYDQNTAWRRSPVWLVQA